MDISMSFSVKAWTVLREQGCQCNKYPGKEVEVPGSLRARYCWVREEEDMSMRALLSSLQSEKNRRVSAFICSAPRAVVGANHGSWLQKQIQAQIIGHKRGLLHQHIWVSWSQVRTQRRYRKAREGSLNDRNSGHWRLWWVSTSRESKSE